jgi:hypothetical protein
MSKKGPFIFCLGIFPLLAIGFDLLRRAIVEEYSNSFSTIPYPLLFDIFAPILMVGCIVWFSRQSEGIILPKAIWAVFVILGFYIVTIPLIRGTILLPAKFLPGIMGSWQPYRTLSGAFWFVTGLFHLKA